MSQTQAKQIKGYLLKVREDLLLNTAFAEILTDTTYLEVKLPTKIENYKYKSFLNFGNLLSFDLVKTRKHWVVTHIECYEKLNFNTWNYHKFEVLVQINKILLQNLHLDQECLILDWVRQILNKIDIEDELNSQVFEADFRHDLETRLGFKPFKSQKTTL